MIHAQLEDGRILEFPDGTDQSIIDSKVKEVLSGSPAQQPAQSQPFPQQPPFSKRMSGEGGSIPEGPGFMESMLEPSNVGAIVGSVAAGTAGLGLAAAVPLAATGAGIGEAYKQIGQHLSGSLDAPKTSIEAAKRIGKEMGLQGGFELVGGLAVKGLGRILAPYKKALVEGAKETATFFKDKIKPLVFMPAEATEARSLDLLHNIAESSLIGGNKMAKFKTKRTQFFNDFADSLIDQFGQRTDPADLGNLFVAAINENKKVHAKAADILYNNVAEMVGSRIEKVPVKEMVESGVLGADGKPVMKEVTRMVEKEVSPVNIPTGRLKSFVKPLVVKSEDLGGIEAKNAGDDLVSAVADLPETLSFDTARELRSRLLSRIDEFSVLNKKAPAIGKAKKLISILDGEIEKSLKGLEVPKLTPAVRTNSGKVYTGTTHGDAINEAIDDGGMSDGIFEAWKNEEIGDLSGYIDKNGKWYTYADAEDLYGSGESVQIKDYIKDAESGVDMTFTKNGEDWVPPAYRSKLSPLEAWRTANRFYKDGQRKFNNTLIRRLIKLADDTGTGSEMIAPAIFKPGHVSAVRKVKTALANNPEEWSKMQGFFMQHILKKSTDTDGNIVGKRILNSISGKPNSFGLPMLHEAFSSPQVRSLEMLGKALQISQSRQAEGAGRVLIQLTQAGAIGSLATGKMALPATTIIIGPAILSRMMLNPTIAKLITEGVSMPAGSSQAAALLSRIIAAQHRAGGE